MVDMFVQCHSAGIEWTDFTGYSIDQNVTADFTPGRNSTKSGTGGAMDDDGAIIDTSGALPGSKAAREAAAARAAEQAAKRSELTIMYPYIPPLDPPPRPAPGVHIPKKEKEKVKDGKDSKSSTLPRFQWATHAADTFGAPWLASASANDEDECVWTTPGSSSAPISSPNVPEEMTGRYLYNGRGPLMLIQGAQHRVESVCIRDDPCHACAWQVVANDINM
jgi:hypothetical protein